MRLAFVYASGRLARLPELRRGEVPSEFFYGAAELERAGHVVEHFEFGAASSSPRLATALDLLRRTYLTPPKTSGSTFLNAWSLSPTLNAFDCVVATVSDIAFALAACASLGRLRAPIVGIQCGLLHHHYTAFRRRITRRLLDRMHSVFFGDAELAPTIELFQADPARFSVNQFGVDTSFWTPAGERQNYVLAIGNDSRRDYATLLAAAAGTPAPIKIITNLPLPEVLPANVTARRGSWREQTLTDAAIRDLYRGAACVVTPLHDTLQPSGQSVTLEAMACGVPVVLSETRGLWNPAVLVDRKNVRLVTPAAPTELATAVREILTDTALAQRLAAAGRETAVQHGNISDFARRIGEKCEQAAA